MVILHNHPMKSSNTFAKLILPVAMLIAAGTSAFGNTVVLNRNTSAVNGYSGANGGGEFRAESATLSNGAYAPSVNVSATGLQVFCLETKESFTPGASYYYTVNTGAISGDTGGNFDALSVGSAWLMTQFAKGTLAGYNYTLGALRTTEATLLQTAFWLLENEPASGGYTGVYNGSTYQAAVVAHFGSLAAARADASLAQLGGVRVINLTTNADGTGWVQSQVVYVPDNSATLALLGLGLIALAVIRRRSV